MCENIAKILAQGKTEGWNPKRLEALETLRKGMSNLALKCPEPSRIDASQTTASFSSVPSPTSTSPS